MKRKTSMEIIHSSTVMTETRLEISAVEERSSVTWAMLQLEPAAEAGIASDSTLLSATELFSGETHHSSLIKK